MESALVGGYNRKWPQICTIKAGCKGKHLWSRNEYSHQQLAIMSGFKQKQVKESFAWEEDS